MAQTAWFSSTAAAGPRTTSNGTPHGGVTGAAFAATGRAAAASSDLMVDAVEAASHARPAWPTWSDLQAAEPWLERWRRTARLWLDAGDLNWQSYLSFRRRLASATGVDWLIAVTDRNAAVLADLGASTTSTARQYLR